MQIIPEYSQSFVIGGYQKHVIYLYCYIMLFSRNPLELPLILYRYVVHAKIGPHLCEPCYISGSNGCKQQPNTQCPQLSISSQTNFRLILLSKQENNFIIRASHTFFFSKVVQKLCCYASRKIDRYYFASSSCIFSSVLTQTG